MKTLVLGNVFVDVIVSVDALPKTGDDLVCNKQTVTIGGCAYNVATILKNFDVQHSLVSPIGKGIYGSLIEKELLENNYGTNIKVESGDNGYCLCLVEKNGERSFITIPGIETKYEKEWFDNIDGSKYDNIYISGYEIEKESGIVISSWLSKQQNKKIFFAPGPRMRFIDDKILNKILDMSPILHLNEDEALKYTHETSVIEAARILNQRTKNTIFITLGKKGVFYFDKFNYKFIEGIETEVANTVGAGDSHIGAIIAAYSRGYNFEDCCYIANKVAARVVAYEGSRLESQIFDKNEYILNIKEA
ncbi:PfkB family carbohydrate kinase [Romboutsia sp.]|uniref:PfkB family carbohydrate kinase n=1 Tax=Romboutsia sp. TaxID=1965302 RepID=UPI003F2E52EC